MRPLFRHFVRAVGLLNAGRAGGARRGGGAFAVAAGSEIRFSWSRISWITVTACSLIGPVDPRSRRTNAPSTGRPSAVLSVGIGAACRSPCGRILILPEAKVRSIARFKDARKRACSGLTTPTSVTVLVRGIAFLMLHLPSPKAIRRWYVGGREGRLGRAGNRAGFYVFDSAAQQSCRRHRTHLRRRSQTSA